MAAASFNVLINSRKNNLFLSLLLLLLSSSSFLSQNSIGCCCFCYAFSFVALQQTSRNYNSRSYYLSGSSGSKVKIHDSNTESSLWASRGNHNPCTRTLGNSSSILRGKRKNNGCYKTLLKAYSSESSSNDDEENNNINDNDKTIATTRTAIKTFIDKSMKTTKNISTKLFPPIPEQEVSTNIWKESITNPQFIQKEFLLGATYMLKRLPVLMIASVLSHILWCRPNTIPLLKQDATAGEVNAVDISELLFFFGYGSLGSTLDNLTNAYLMPAKNQINQLLKLIGLKPLLEEIFYRGIDPSIVKLSLRLNLYLLSWISGKISWLLGLGFFLYGSFPNLLFIFSVIPRFMSSPKTLLIIKLVALLKVTGDILSMLLPIKFKLINEARKKSKRRKQTRLSSEESSKKSNDTTNRSKIIKLLSPKEEIEDEDKFKSQMDNALNLCGRFEGSRAFAMAHIGSPLSLSHQYLRVQKCVGTFFSSFLIESRLVVCRKTLWAAIGAHVCYNTITALLALVSSYFKLSFYPALVPV